MNTYLCPNCHRVLKSPEELWPEVPSGLNLTSAWCWRCQVYVKPVKCWFDGIGVTQLRIQGQRHLLHLKSQGDANRHLLNMKRTLSNEPLSSVEIDDEIFRHDPNKFFLFGGPPKKPGRWKQLRIWLGEFPFRFSLKRLLRDKRGVQGD